MSQQVDGPDLSRFVASETIPQFRRCRITSGKLALADATAAEVGLEVGVSQARKVLDEPLTVRNPYGRTCKVEASAAILEGAAIEAAADGRVAPETSGAHWGVALEAASGAGSIIECIRN